MPRIALIEPDDMTPEQAEIHRNSPAGKMDIFRLLAQARTIWPAQRQMAQAIFTTLIIPDQEREIVVLATLHLDRGEYEWAQHAQIATDMGIALDKIDAIAQGHFTASTFSAREQALLAFTRQVVKLARVDDDVFNAVAAVYDARQLVETIWTIGFYMTLARITGVAELAVDAVNGAAVVSTALAEAFKDPPS